MSNSLAIAVVTAALQDLLLRAVAPQFPGEPELSDTSVSTLPLDVHQGSEKNQLNLFLYQVTPNAAWRNLATTTQGALTDHGKPPLAIDLYYLLTGYGKGDDELRAHLLLGRAMAMLQDQAILTPDMLAGALKSRPLLLASNVHNQIERIRITPQPVSLDEMSKLWGVFQSKYRISVAYHVAVVLIDSLQNVPPPLPVLWRGTLESGTAVVPNLTTQGWPQLLELRLPKVAPSANLGFPGQLLAVPVAQETPGDIITVTGVSLLGESLQVVLRGGFPGEYVLPDAKVLTKEPTRVSFQLPSDQSELPAGPYSVVLRSKRPGLGSPALQSVSSNALPFALAPRILRVAYQSATPSLATRPSIGVRCSPQVWPGQSVSLLIGDRELLLDQPATFSLDPRLGPLLPIPLQPTPLQPTPKLQELRFLVNGPALPAGRYVVRLRVDGIDSFPVSNLPGNPPSFDPTQQLVIP